MSSARIPFLDLIKEQIRIKQTKLCLGIDPHLAGRLPPFFQEELYKGVDKFLLNFSSSLIDACQHKIVAVKIQSSFFECHGALGFETMRQVISFAHSRGLPVIWDAKRGDISSTMAAYGELAFDHLKANAMTVTPYMGVDVVSALSSWMERGAFVYAVWIPSNPGGRYLVAAPEGNSCAEQVWTMLREGLSPRLLDQLGYVVGATVIDQLTDTLFVQCQGRPLLIPGMGFQGGGVTERLQTLVKSETPHLIPMSRSLAGLGQPDFFATGASWGRWNDFEDWVAGNLESAAISGI